MREAAIFCKFNQSVLVAGKCDTLNNDVHIAYSWHTKQDNKDTAVIVEARM